MKVRRRWRAAELALAATLMGGAGACDAPRPAACPGERVGSFAFRAEPLPASAGTGCVFASDVGISFTGTVSYTSESEAVLCLDRAEATPLRGARAGNRIAVASPRAPATVAQCACGVEVTESVEGDVSPDEAVTFRGELRNALAAAPGTDPASCEAGSDGGVRCGVPCELRWQLTGSR